MQFKTKKQNQRYASLMPNGAPKKIRCYDIGDKVSDRYTCVFTGSYRKNTTYNEFWYLGASADPFHPMGIGHMGSSASQIDRPSYSHLGKKIKFEELPEKVRQYITETYLYLWGFTDEDGKQIK